MEYMIISAKTFQGTRIQSVVRITAHYTSPSRLRLVQKNIPRSILTLLPSTSHLRLVTKSEGGTRPMNESSNACPICY
jgi:hypothetical protein